MKFPTICAIIAVLSIAALITIAMGATQNRASLLGVVAGAAAGLLFLPGRERLRLIARAAAVTALTLGLALALSLRVPAGSHSQAREFSASQLIDNVLSIGKGAGAGSLGGTVTGRNQLWSLIYDKQVTDGKLLYGFGFGVNLPYLVGDTQVTSGPNPLRSPHNSHDDVLARMGLLGVSLWIVLWLSWYRQVIAGCGRLARRGLHTRRQAAVLCLMVVTAILVSSYFSPQLEGAQVAVIQWTAFGVGIAVTSFRGWFRSGAAGTVDPEHPRLLQPDRLPGGEIQPRVLPPEPAERIPVLRMHG